MRVLKAHLFVMLDVAVGSPLQPVDKEILQRLKSNGGPAGEAFERLMDSGSNWIFYGKGYTDEHGSRQRVEVFLRRGHALACTQGRRNFRTSGQDGRQ
jgi:hypothetical protein